MLDPTDSRRLKTSLRATSSHSWGLPGIGFSATLASTLVTGLLLCPTAVRAACSTSDDTETCTGSDIPNLTVTGSDATSYVYEQVTGNFGPQSSGDGDYAFSYSDKAADGADTGPDVKPYDGQDGEDASSAYNMSLEMHFDQGYGVNSVTGGISITSTGGWGGFANKSEDNGGAVGGAGGAGGNGGQVTIKANANKAGTTLKPITTQNGSGILVVSKGGNGGAVATQKVILPVQEVKAVTLVTAVLSIKTTSLKGLGLRLQTASQSTSRQANGPSMI